MRFEWMQLISLGSYDEFDLANETDTLEQFLKLAPPAEPEAPAKSEVCQNNNWIELTRSQIELLTKNILQ